MDSNHYDTLAERAIPDYYHCLDIVASHIPLDATRIIDLGIGTGNLETRLFRKNPSFRVVGFDLDREALLQAEKKHTAYHLALFQGDFSILKFPQADAFVSCLAIHHLEDEEKKNLFEKIYKQLYPEGVFVNYDYLKGETLQEEQKNKETIITYWKAQGFTDIEIAAGLEDIKKNDKPQELSKQRASLLKLGFRFTTLYHQQPFAVYACKK